MSIKLNVLLGKVEHLASPFKASIKGFLVMFDKNRDHFKGLKKTYTPKPDTQDFPSERTNKVVATTVEEHLKWFEDTNSEYLQGLFDVEATNGSGRAKVELIVDGESWGMICTLELMRAISILETAENHQMYATLPVRSDSEIWVPSKNEQYEGRAIYEQAQQSGIKRITDREQYILEDRNIEKAIAAGKTIQYTPQIAIKETVQEIGEWTLQNFSGETSSRERAEILRRYTRLLVACKEALKKANEVEIVPSSITPSKLFGYLHKGKIEKSASL